MAKKLAKSNQEAISLSGEALWAELEKIGFYGANLRACVVNSKFPREGLHGLYSAVNASNADVAGLLGEEPPVFELTCEINASESVAPLLDLLAQMQAYNLATRQRLQEQRKKYVESLAGESIG